MSNDIRDRIGRYDFHYRTGDDVVLQPDSGGVLRSISDEDWFSLDAQHQQWQAMDRLVDTLKLNGVVPESIEFTFDPDDEDEPMFFYQARDAGGEVLDVDPDVNAAIQQFANAFDGRTNPSRTDRRLVPTDTTANRYAMVLRPDRDAIPAPVATPDPRAAQYPVSDDGTIITVPAAAVEKGDTVYGTLEDGSFGELGVALRAMPIPGQTDGKILVVLSTGGSVTLDPAQQTQIGNGAVHPYDPAADMNARVAALADRNTPVETLRYEADLASIDPRVLTALASNRNADDNVLYRVATIGHEFSVQALILEHPNVSRATIEAINRDVAIGRHTGERGDYLRARTEQLLGRA